MAKINSIDSKQLVVMGNDAYDYGTFSQTVTMPNGKTADQSGYYLVTLHKGSDGAWKITHHVSTNPPAAH
jgi:ketosteroid isomerase-like protein